MAVHLARADHVDGGLLLLHDVHLRTGCLRAQQYVAFAPHRALLATSIDYVESVLHRTARMILGSVERREVIPVGLDLATTLDLVADAGKDVSALANDAVDEMLAADGHATPGQRDIDGTSRELGVELGGLEQRLALVERRFDHVAHLVGELADNGALLLGNVAHAAQHGGERTLLAEHADAHFFERVARLGPRNGGERLVAQAFQFFLQRHSLVLSTNRPHDVRAIKNAPA